MNYKAKIFLTKKPEKNAGYTLKSHTSLPHFVATLRCSLLSSTLILLQVPSLIYFFERTYDIATFCPSMTMNRRSLSAAAVSVLVDVPEGWLAVHHKASQLNKLLDISHPNPVNLEGHIRAKHRSLNHLK